MLKRYSHIQIAVDGSRKADLAFPKIVAIVRRNNANLEILHVIDTRLFQNVSSLNSTMVKQVSTDARRKLEEYYDRTIKAGIKNVHYSIEFGFPKTIIAHEFSQKYQTDLIVLGATGLNVVEGLLIDNVIEYVTRTADCNVTVIRWK